MSELIRREDAIKGLEYKRVIMAEADGFGGGYVYEDGQCDAFTESIEFLKRMPTASPWHRVEDGLPDKVGSYLVYAPTYTGGSSSAKECKAGVMFARWLKGGHWSIEVGYYKRPGCVTHWMPIEPPKEEEHGN